MLDLSVKAIGNDETRGATMKATEEQLKTRPNNSFHCLPLVSLYSKQIIKSYKEKKFIML